MWPEVYANSSYISSNMFVSPFALPYRRLHQPVQAHAHTREHVSHECDRLCMCSSLARVEIFCPHLQEFEKF